MARWKIGVVGAGNVGATAAQRIAEKGLGDVVLTDIAEGMPQGKALDLMEARAVEYHDMSITGSNSTDALKGCDIVVITAGVPRKPGMDRSDLLSINSKIIESVMDGILANGDSPIIIVVTNPLDVMAYQAFKKSGFDKHRVIGMAGVLDSSRFAYFIAEKLDVSIKDISPMVLGGHGNSMVPLPRYTTVSGVSIVDLMSAEEIEALVDRTRKGGAEIVALLKTGSAFYAPASSISAMVESIVKDEKRILPCAAYLEGEYDLNDVYVGVPCKLGENGIEQIVELNLSDDEKKELHTSAAAVRENIDILAGAATA